MSDVIENMARAMALNARGIDLTLGPSDLLDSYVELAQAAMDYLQQRPAISQRPIPEGQGPEMTQEQLAALDRFKAVWQPICDVLRGDAP